MTGDVHPGLVLVSPCSKAGLLISSTAKRCQSVCWRGALMVAPPARALGTLTLGMAGQWYETDVVW